MDAYKLSTIHNSSNAPYIAGPGDGFDYHSGVLWPQRLDEFTEEQIERIVGMLNRAYRAGYQAKRQEIQKALA